MKKNIRIILAIALTTSLFACDSQSKKEESNTQKADELSATPEKPSDTDLMAFKVYHHMRYMVTTSEQAGGTNKLFHTRKLPTEGSNSLIN